MKRMPTTRRVAVKRPRLNSRKRRRLRWFRENQPPEPRQLACPGCSKPHIDRGEWATRRHRTHLCEFCGFTWRPFKFPTIGVAA